MATQLSTKKNSLAKPFDQRLEAEALFISIGDGALTTDEYGRITRINPAALKMLGYKANELLKQPLIKTLKAVAFDGSTMNIIDRPITQAYLTGKPATGKMYYRTKRGRLLPVAITVSPIMIGDRPIGSIEIIRNITLEFEVDKMKSEFISIASHQLRTPLSAIKTYTHILDDGYSGKLNVNQKEYLETIIKATNRMNELISTLLNITKIESGTIALNPKIIKLDQIVQEIMPELKLMADAKNIELSLCVKPKNGSTELKTDSLIVKEIITNLVSNSIKYTPDKGKVSIVIRPHKDDILTEIRDTGWGIPQAAHEKVFSKFYRGSNVIKKVTSGTGLGLYLVRGLIDNLGGQIWFESEEKHGTCFFFTLPRKVKLGSAKTITAKVS